MNRFLLSNSNSAAVQARHPLDESPAMTKHTPDSLRSRVSSLSLRLQAMEAAEALSRSQSPAPSMLASTTLPSSGSNTAPASKPFLLADMNGRSPAENPVCDSCWNALRYSEVRQTTRAAHPSACKLCAVAAGKPEAYTKPFVDFLSENPTIFHAVSYFKDKLAAAGFTELPARESWADKLQPGGKYWTTRNGSALIAFTVGEAYKPGNGVAMVAGHIDALTAKLKPVSSKPTRAGYLQLGVAPYAGALNQTWWDRDLSIGGRVIVRDESSHKTTTKLVRLDWPIARIPTLAPHFGVGMMGQNNPETQAVPIIGLESPSDSSTPVEPLGPKGAFVNTQPPKLVKLISKELGLASPTQILNWELELYDSQPAQTGGLDREFIFGGRIDDKLCSWAALTGLLAAESDPNDGIIKLVALFDDEEIGSLLRQGARGNFLPLTIERAVESLSTVADVPFGTDVLCRTFASSFLLSADVTHAGNPNFLGYYLEEHVPRLNVGIAICGDSNGHMTTDAVSTAILQRVGELSGAPTQTFQIRNDTRSGGTVGPMLSAAMGVRAADAGLPQLSMHSIRATTGALDPGLGVKFFKGFLDHWEKVDAEWQ
ncbi:vacuolar ATPase assembly integral membrane protein vma-21 [Colletotrichum spaethianum]|uniref:Vacuolar ATPase assembly integral membrane protein vma-21 n=1 Tax=Colletotrichum spaethianum TaxID=700344 RepID=A0AA37L7M9_9PEZI|nr:vacuolar ATPase assembly integral membrane protein vma-21 [Colletotrichum spaethianum]GKT41163.1 vacuolar ATPase assembly integral membrane protein vma-21 [Colletotrichum spaethianum]